MARGGLRPVGGRRPGATELEVRIGRRAIVAFPRKPRATLIPVRRSRNAAACLLGCRLCGDPVHPNARRKKGWAWGDRLPRPGRSVRTCPMAIRLKAETPPPLIQSQLTGVGIRPLHFATNQIRPKTQDGYHINWENLPAPRERLAWAERVVAIAIVEVALYCCPNPSKEELD